MNTLLENFAVKFSERFIRKIPEENFRMNLCFFISGIRERILRAIFGKIVLKISVIPELFLKEVVEC